MRPSLALVLTLALGGLPPAPARAQYNAIAGHNAPASAADLASEPGEEARREKAAGRLRADGDGAGAKQQPQHPRQAPRLASLPARDAHGNAQGSQYDLAVDGAFDGQTVLIVDLYHPAHNLDFSQAANAIKRKGFSVARYHAVPPVKELKAALAKSSQFWLISSCDNQVHLSAEHHRAVKEFFDAGHGVYLWGDNDPCNADADRPVIHGSAGNLIAAAFESGGKRLLVDGGFTRLQYKWDTAGTSRYVMNAAAWLANYERFGDEVVAERHRKKGAKK